MNMWSIIIFLFFSHSSFNCPIKDAECTSKGLFATATVETEYGGFVSCTSIWGFPKLSVGLASKIKRFKLECTDDQKIKIKNFKDTLSGLNNLIGLSVKQKLEGIELLIHQEKINFKDYEESITNYSNEMDKLDSENKKRFEKIFN